MKKKTILIAAGGTGGHLYPGVALAEELAKTGADVSFAVRKRDLAVKILTEKKIKYVEIPAAAFPRRSAAKLMPFVFINAAGIFSAWRLLRALRPSAVIGMGAYVSFPVIAAAKIVGVPTIIHEQNSVPGLANKSLARLVDKVAVSFPASVRFFDSSKTVVTGNPVREEIPAARRNPKKFDLSDEKFTVLVFGGSQGAASVNSCAVAALGHLKPLRGNIQFIHLTGDADYFRIKEVYSSGGFHAAVYPYLREMGDAYASSDLVVCRAGATTLAELSFIGVPALLIPYPRATDGHQDKNAAAYLAAGYPGETIDERDLSPEILADKIGGHYKNFSGHAVRAADETHVLPQKLLAAEVMRLAGGD